MLFMPDWNAPIKSPYLFLILGGISLSAALVWTYTGKVWIRFHGWLYRSEEPGWFWWQVSLYCLIGVGCIWYFVHSSQRS
jgi:hypothetical protein